jgi:hypothetical protein
VLPPYVRHKNGVIADVISVAWIELEGLLVKRFGFVVLPEYVGEEVGEIAGELSVVWIKP